MAHPNDYETITLQVNNLFELAEELSKLGEYILEAYVYLPKSNVIQANVKVRKRVEV